MKLIHIILISALVLGACKKKSSKIDQNTIFQSYEMTYDAGNNITTLYARFYENNEDGKTVILDENSSIKVFGENMTLNNDVYMISFYGEIAEGKFLYTDADGNEYFNTLPKEDEISNDEAGSIDNNTNTNWFFGGNVLGTGEVISAQIDSYEENGGNSESHTTEGGTDHVEIKATDMVNLQPGSARIYMKRTTTMSSGNWTAAGGKKKTGYTSPIKEILIY